MHILYPSILEQVLTLHGNLPLCFSGTVVLAIRVLSHSGLITSVGEERAIFSVINFSLLCGFCSEKIPLPLGANDRLLFYCGTPRAFHTIILGW